MLGVLLSFFFFLLSLKGLQGLLFLESCVVKSITGKTEKEGQPRGKGRKLQTKESSYQLKKGIKRKRERIIMARHSNSSSFLQGWISGLKKQIRSHVDKNAEFKEESENAKIIEVTLGAPEKSKAELAQAILAGMMKISCGGLKGTSTVSGTEVTVNAKKELAQKQFEDLLAELNTPFRALPAGNSSASAIAEASYLCYVQKHCTSGCFLVLSFPPCLMFQAAYRADMVVAGYVIFSIVSQEDNSTVLRIFQKNSELIFSGMCSASFTEDILKKRLEKTDNLSNKELENIMEATQSAISDFWENSPQDDHCKSQARFLMASFGSDLSAYMKTRFEEAGGACNCSRKVVEHAVLCLEDWKNTCTKLSTIDWSYTWGTTPFTDPILNRILTRLQKLLSLRELMDEVKLLLSDHTPSSPKGAVDSFFEVFNGVDFFASSPSVDDQFTTALTTFYKRIEPMEHRCAVALSEFFSTSSHLSPQAVLNFFLEYKQLVKRPIVSKELVAERDAFLAKLNERLQSMRLEFEHRAETIEDEAVLEEEDKRCQTGRFLPGPVNNIIWLKQISWRVEEMSKMCQTVLSDLSNSNNFLTASRQLLEDIDDYEKDCFKAWVENVQDHQSELELNADAPLMSIDKTGELRVNFSERLVQLLKEVRMFSALGYTIPSRIRQLVKEGQMYYEKGLGLKHICTTYNSMAQDIIPSTRAMLLEPAIGFEKIITGSDSNRLTWKSEIETEGFIRKLKKACRSLTVENRRLHRLHREIHSIVLELFNIDLLRSRERWLGRVQQIQNKMENSGFRNLEAWKNYWDMQIYKALESQYQKGLESLHETVEEIKADIIVDPETGDATLRPSLEAMRHQYYQRIKDFLTFPIRFRGCSEAANFASMPSRNEQGIYSVMQHAAALFKKVEHELKRFTPMLIIGKCGKGDNPSLEAIAGASLTEVQHWEQAIRLLKQKGKEINAEEFFIKCGCITLCTAGIKGVVEDHLNKLSDALRVTLKRSAEAHIGEIEEYLDKVTKCLDAKLANLTEIGEANVQYAKLLEERGSKEVHFQHFYNKNLLLEGMSGGFPLDYQKTKTKWKICMDRLDGHESEVEAQLQTMRDSVTGVIQQWDKDLERFVNQWKESKPKSMDAVKPLDFIEKKQKELALLKETAEEFTKQCRFFQMDEPDLSILEEMETDVKETMLVWTTLTEFQVEVKTLRQENWITFRTKIYRFEDCSKLWTEKLKELPADPVIVYFRTILDKWTRCIGCLKYVRGDGFTPAHWTELFSMLGLKNVTQDTLKFGQILDKHENIIKNEAALKKLHARVQGEAQVREALDDVKAWGKETRFNTTSHPDREGVILITDWKDLLSSLSDNQALLTSMKDSPYFSIFASDANKWEERLSVLDDYLRNMNQIQRKWVYLEPIFRRGALPSQQDRFNKIDQHYLAIMKSVKNDTRVINLASHPEYKDILVNVLEQLELCQKSLNKFLELKRDSFPRFYFISDDDLLEILALSKNPTVIQAHLKKLFMGISRVMFDQEQENIIKILSVEGEEVPLTKPVHITDEVEFWLSELDDEMKATLKTHLQQCYAKMDIGLYASQILCAAEMIRFTVKTEEAIKNSKSGGLTAHRNNLQAQLRELNLFAGRNADPLIGLKLKSIIMDLIHNIEVVTLLIKHKVDKETDWLWRKQLRYYLDSTGSCVLRMVDAEFKYSYEYQGNAPKLVHTPLTDRCYLTLTQGMQLGYGGNPYGPAGTGKTESVKALGVAMGRQVLVFNCDEGIDFKSMGRIFTGLVKCGSWGCFDEFNRLKVDQLSAVSQMIQVIQEALKNGDSYCHLLGREINVNPNAGIFVTLNPAGKGYGGRSKLPDNLKQLFRSISMSAPDNDLIVETILFSEGFENGKLLARKVVEIFSLSQQLLSYQQHYDWGLRAMKAVLRLGGSLIHEYLMERVSSKAQPTAEEVLEKESEILIKSLRVNTLSKLSFDDALLFSNLIDDVFPDVPVREIEYAQLRPAIEGAIKELGLQLVEPQIQKILQLYEALQQRMGVVLVGPSGSGKSTLLRVLRNAMMRLGTSVPMYVMNPKALPRQQLLGHMDPDTREWFDGVLTEAARKVVKETGNVRSWVFCDGDIDPEWVESLNSVLDDNKLLTMPNGVRIQFSDNVNFLFETHSLEFASPATVSRMGIIYLSEEDVDPKSAVASWLKEQPEDTRPQLEKWISSYFYQALESLMASEKLIVCTTKIGLVMSGLSQLRGSTSKSQFAMGLVYGFGSYLPEDARKEYAKDIFYLCGEKIPGGKELLGFRYSAESNGYMMYEFEPPLDLSVDELFRHPMISTIDCQRAMDIMQAWLKPIKPGVFRPFVLVGPEGCGKTMLLTNLFQSTSGMRVATINCSAQTEARQVIQKLKQCCQMLNSTKGKLLRPREERLVLILKDLNLPKPDKYGTVQLHSLLQQLILYNGFYDDDLEWVIVEKLQIVGSMNPPGSMGRYPVAPRFLSITSVLSLSYPSKESLQLIYTEFLSIMMQSKRLQLSLPGKGAADVARVMITVFDIISTRCTVDVASHYIFNPRDLTKWALNLLNYSNDDVVEGIAYEGRRIFVDRLITTEERQKLSKVIKDNVTFLVGRDRDTTSDKETVFYVSWIQKALRGQNAKLCACSMDDLKKSAETFLLSYSREFADLSVQLIPEVCSWLARVDRVLSQERGNLLLVARSGVCAAEVVKLVAFSSRSEVVSLAVTREYGWKQFTTELKSILLKTGVEGQNTVLLLEDHHFFDPRFLEAINSLLSSREVPGLFSPEELDGALGPLKAEAESEGLSTAAWFLERISRFLHITVIMDPTNPNYELRCRSNPALFTHCNVYWMGAWDSSSLKVLPRLLIPNTFKDLDARGHGKKEFSLTTEVVHMHKLIGDDFSPEHFKVLCHTYEHLYSLKHKEVANSLERLASGVAKLDEAQANVDSIASDVQEKKDLLEKKQKEADEALKEIQAKMEEAGEQKRSIHKIQKELEKDQKAIQERKTVIEGRLSGIQPVLDSALNAVSAIRSDHLTELKSMKQPPPAVQEVMEGVILLIMGGKIGDNSWAAIRKILSGDIKGQILNYDIDNVTDSCRSVVDKYLTQKENSFRKEVIGRASKAAAPMAEWLKAVVEYSKVLETVGPLRAELKEAENNLVVGQESMARYQHKLKKLEGKVEELKVKFGERSTEAQRLKSRLEQAEGLLNNATDLLSKLSTEHARWSHQMTDIRKDMDQLPARCLLAAGYITYLGRETENERARILAEWMEKVKIKSFKFFTFLREESMQLHYKAEGLPVDELSMDNAVMLQEQVRTPFLEDPNGQALTWILNSMKAKKQVVETCSLSEERLVSALELALRFGKKFIITDVDKVEPFMYPIIRKELHNEGAKKVIQIGDRRTVDYADGFQLFLVTRSAELHVPPDIISYLTPVSFSITQSGLEGQFLGVTIQHEQPELEKEKLETLQAEESLKIQLNELEESLLSDLANSKGSLLENKTLIDSLNLIKNRASEIGDALQRSREVQEEIDTKRNVYRPFAAVASRVFFLTKSLRELSHMYQFSFSLFMELFKKTLEQHKELRTDPETKINTLKESFIVRTVKTVTRSLLKEHRIVYGIHLSRALRPDDCTKEEWDFFLDKAVASEEKKKEVRPPAFVLPESVDMFRTFAALFPELMSTLRFYEADVWLQWMRAGTPEVDYPSFVKKLTDFQRLLLMKTLRSDRLIAAMNVVACKYLGVSSLGETETLATTVESTESTSPLLLITTAGADPSQELQSIAYHAVGKDRFHQLAMGGGQTDEALRLVRAAAERGEWVFLKNLHLVLPWVYTLQKEYHLLQPHKNFRLFLTTEAHNEFPSILLSQSMKVMIESPPGIKQNLVRTYNDWGKALFESITAKQRELLFIAASLHAVVQERRSYIPQGWSKVYEITTSDLKSATDIILRQSRQDVDWRTIRGLLESAIYGGKMETMFDTRILETYIRKFFDPDSMSSAKRQDPLFHTVRVPKGGLDYEVFMDVIHKLPENDVPMLFSLPPNADRAVQQSAVGTFISDLLHLNEAREETTMGRKEWAEKLAPILASWAELTAPHADLLSSNSASLIAMTNTKPIEGFVVAELAAAQRLVSMVDQCMNDLRKVIDGVSLLTEGRRQEASFLIQGTVPPAWDGFFSGSERILPWLQALLRRAIAILHWNQIENTLLKTPINLSNFMRPKTFLNALRQETAHALHKPLVSLQLVATTASSPPASAPICVKLELLLLQGATISSSNMLQFVETADQPAAVTIPNVFVGWSMTPLDLQYSTPVPVYANSTKETHLCDFMLPCESDIAARQLVLAGISIILEP